MLNQSTIKTESGATRKTILVDELNSTAVSCKVANTGIDADADGKKIAYAGSPLFGDLTARDTAFTISGEGDPVGVLLHDVDVTEGTKNAQVVIFGTVDLSKLGAEARQLVNISVNKYKMINFVK